MECQACRVARTVRAIALPDLRRELDEGNLSPSDIGTSEEELADFATA
jgi:hypothetical protein